MKNLNSLYGAIGGDIIGSAFEYNNIKTTAFNLFSKRLKSPTTPL